VAIMVSDVFGIPSTVISVSASLNLPSGVVQLNVRDCPTPTGAGLVSTGSVPNRRIPVLSVTMLLMGRRTKLIKVVVAMSAVSGMTETAVVLNSVSIVVAALAAREHHEKGTRGNGHPCVNLHAIPPKNEPDLSPGGVSVNASGAQTPALAV
jgi:hypothetical protein